jgi:hypothetical protein
MYNIVMKTPEVLVIDEFLSIDDREKIFNQVQVDRWRATEIDDKFWHMTDGFNYKGVKRWGKDRPHNNNAEIWFENFTKFLNTCPDVIDFVSKDYYDISMQCHGYPVGSKNPWHTDLGYTTYTYYLHKHWQINWDSTLLVIPKDAQVKYQQLLTLDSNSVHTDSYAKDNMPMEMFEQHNKYKTLIEHGLGIFVSPKPNRLILINKGVIHGVTRVDSDAGENIRVSLTGAIWDH